LFRERIGDEAREIDRSEAATSVRGQKFFRAGITGLERFAIIQVVVAIDVIEKENAGLRVVVGGTHDLVPEIARAYLAIHPQPVAALVGPGLLEIVRGLKQAGAY